MIDIRLFHERLCPGREFRFLGFNSSAAGGGPEQIDLNVSLDEIRNLNNMDALSTVVPDDFRTLSRVDSMGWKSAVEVGPFDVVNLDLCGTFLADRSTDRSMYAAVTQLCALQSKATGPWLLLLTTRVDRDLIDDEVLALLEASLSQNLDDCAKFESTFRELLGVGESDELSKLCSVEHGGGQWLPYIGTALAGWLHGLAHEADMEFEVKSCMSYRVQSGAGPDDLLSVAMRFSPRLTPVTDRAGVAPAPEAVDRRCEDAARIPRRLGKVRKVDEILRANAALAQELAEETGTLLEQARYSRSEYLASSFSRPA